MKTTVNRRLNIMLKKIEDMEAQRAEALVICNAAILRINAVLNKMRTEDGGKVDVAHAA